MGRLRYTAEQRATMLDAFAASGLGGAEFAKLHGVKYQTFAHWLQQRRRAGARPGLPAPATLAFVEVAAPAARADEAMLTVRLSGGAEIRVGKVDAIPLAAALIRELSRPC